MIYLGADHGGFELKEKIKIYLIKRNYRVRDLGAFTFNPDDDYPDFIKLVAETVSKDPSGAKGIVIGGSGQAEMMLANKYKGVRCALFYTPAIPTKAADIKGRISTDLFEIIRLTREHNNANMLSLGARFLKESDALSAVDKWLNEPFPGHKRHVRRNNKMFQIEKELFENKCDGGDCCK